MKVRIKFPRIGTWYDQLPSDTIFEGWKDETKPGIIFISESLYVFDTDCEIDYEKEG